MKNIIIAVLSVTVIAFGIRLLYYIHDEQTYNNYIKSTSWDSVLDECKIQLSDTYFVTPKYTNNYVFGPGEYIDTSTTLYIY